MRQRVNRRRFLKISGGVTGAGLIAGCLGDDPDPSDPDPSDPEPSDPDPSDDPVEEDDFPTRPIQHIIPFGPGGGYDTYSRLLAPHVSEVLGEDVRVRNVEGAGGRIGTELVANATPDGYTELNVNMVNFSLTQLTEDVEYDLREFTIYAQYADEFRGIAVAPHTGIETFDEYVEAVANNELRFASTGHGSGYVTVPGVLGDLSGLYPAENVMDNQVIYDGRGEAVQGLLAGDVDVMSGSYWSILDYTTQAGGDASTMIMALTMEDESPEQTPGISTLANEDVENGQEIMDMLATRRLVAGTPGIPENRAQIMRDAYAEVLQSDAFLADAEEAGRPVVFGDHESAAAGVVGFINEWEEREELLNLLFGLD